MRIALISDIHGNATALEAVLADLHQQHVDAIICLGDVATIGPQPKQILAKLKAVECICLLGNHDAALPHAAFSEVIAVSDIPIRSWWLQQYAPTYANSA
jgi:predicted phosphodiesterase